MHSAAWKDIRPLAVSIAICQAAGAMGAVVTARSIPTWYRGLRQPQEAPPNWVFGPVWTTLYTLMGVAAYLVWRRGPQDRRVQAALGVFGLQLTLNLLWSVVFFGARSTGGGLAVILALWAAIQASIWKFSKVSLAAGLLLVPYQAWVSFASYLNYRLWQLNR